MAVERLNRSHTRVKLPKLGWVWFRLSRSLDEVVIRSATLTRDGKHWFVSFLVDDGLTTPDRHAQPGSAVGVETVRNYCSNHPNRLESPGFSPGEDVERY